MASQTIPSLVPMISADGVGDLGSAFRRIAQSTTFRRCHGLTSLLRYLVESTGTGTTVDQRSIARDVFGKHDFDPTIDPSVRVQLTRLRAKLREYYRVEGQRDPWQIEVGERHYGAKLLPRELGLAEPNRGEDGLAPVEATEIEARHAIRPNTIAVLPFVNLTNDPAHDSLCHGLTDELISVFTKWPDVEVLSRGATFQFAGESHDVREIGRRLGVALALEGSARVENHQVRITAQLSSTESGFVLWSESMDFEDGTPLEAQSKAAEQIQSKLKGALPAWIRTGVGEPTQ